MGTARGAQLAAAGTLGEEAGGAGSEEFVG